MDFCNQIRDILMTFPSVVEKPNMFGTKLAYFFREREFAHFHSESQLDIKISKTEAAEIAAQAMENPFSSDWILFNINSEQDARKALLLLKRAYEKVA